MVVRKSAVSSFALGVAGLLLAALTTAQAQKPVHHETNASRQARIARTIDETYAHRWEIFGGGGLLRFHSGSDLKSSNQVAWATSANYFFNPRLYVKGDARGEFGHAKVNSNPYNVYNPQINEYNFMGGVGYRFYAQEKYAISAEALGGTAWGIFSGGAKGLPGTDLGIWQDGIKPAFSVGVNFDYNFYPDLAFRLTPTYVGTTFSSAPGTTSTSMQNNFGFNAGIVYRFGRQ
jgi:hypothetical protein